MLSSSRVFCLRPELLAVPLFPRTIAGSQTFLFPETCASFGSTASVIRSNCSRPGTAWRQQRRSRSKAEAQKSANSGQPGSTPAPLGNRACSVAKGSLMFGRMKLRHRDSLNLSDCYPAGNSCLPIDARVCGLRIVRRRSFEIAPGAARGTSPPYAATLPEN